MLPRSRQRCAISFADFTARHPLRDVARCGCRPNSRKEVGIARNGEAEEIAELMASSFRPARRLIHWLLTVFFGSAGDVAPDRDLENPPIDADSC